MTRTPRRLVNVSAAAMIVLAATLSSRAATDALDEPRGMASAPPIDLAALLEEAAEQSPAVRAAHERLSAAEHVQSQKEALPDPLLQTSYTNDSLDSLTLGSSPDSNLTVSWTQELPYSGKRRLAGDLARLEAGVVASTIELVALDAVTRVKLAYLELHRIDRVRQVVQDNRKLLVTLRELAQARVESGSGHVDEALRAGAEIARFDAELAKLEGERGEAEAALSGALGRTGASTFGPAEEPLIALPFDPATLERETVQRSPQVAALRAMERRDEGRVEVSRRALKPDFMWTAAYMHRGGLDPMVMGGIGVRLPVYRDGKQDQAVLQSERELAAARLDIEAATASSLARVRALLAEVAAAEVHHRALEQAAVPLARSALEARYATFESGRADLTTALLDLRGLVADMRDMEEIEAERLKALVMLEPLTGQELLRPSGEIHEAP